MDIEEFLVHLNLHLKMNLDYVFSSDLKEILKFFTAIEDFMEQTFGNKELEIKIDMMRLVIRMTNATYFIDKIYMLSQMNIKYLDYWQTFSLFTQVLMSELLTAGQPIKNEYKMTKKKTAQSTFINCSTLDRIEETEFDNKPEEEIRVSNYSSSQNLALTTTDKPKRKKGLFGMNLEDTVTQDDSDEEDLMFLKFKKKHKESEELKLTKADSMGLGGKDLGKGELRIKGDGSVDKRIERDRAGVINDKI